MTRMLKYMVYNPQSGRPRVYYDTYEDALRNAKLVSAKERQDVLVLKVIAKVKTRIEQDVDEIIKELR